VEDVVTAGLIYRRATNTVTGEPERRG